MASSSAAPTPAATADSLAASSSPVRVRLPDPCADAAALSQVQVSAWRGAYTPLLTPAQLTSMEAEWTAGEQARVAAWLAPRPWTTFVACTNDDSIPQPCGYIRVQMISNQQRNEQEKEQTKQSAELLPSSSDAASSFDVPSSGEILSLHVHTSAWRRGVGSALVAAGLAELRRQGASQVHLWVVRDNAPARRFYERVGFKVDGQERLDVTRALPWVEVRYTYQPSFSAAASSDVAIAPAAASSSSVSSSPSSASSLVASCHCGACTLTVPALPPTVTDCNCSICHRLGVLWAYFTPSQVEVSGATDIYSWRDHAIGFHSCRVCHCTTHWAPLRDATRQRMGVNARLFPLEVLAKARVRRLDGAFTEKYIDPE